MPNIRHRKLAIGLAVAILTLLSIGAVAPVAAADPNDAAVLQAAATLNGSYGSVAIGYPGPIYTAPTNSGYAAVPTIQGIPTPYYTGVVPPYVRFDPDGETSGTYQIDYSAAD